MTFQIDLIGYADERTKEINPEDLSVLMEVLEQHPQLWFALRAFAKDLLHPKLYRALEREGYGGRPNSPITDLPRNGRVKCQECGRVESCPTQDRQRNKGLQKLHRCKEYEK